MSRDLVLSEVRWEEDLGQSELLREVLALLLRQPDDDCSLAARSLTMHIGDGIVTRKKVNILARGEEKDG